MVQVELTHFMEHKMYEIIHDVITGEIVHREFTPEEIAAVENGKANEDARLLAVETEAIAKVTTRQAVLDKLGLSADEVTALLN
jgi:hypothetical protein